MLPSGGICFLRSKLADEFADDQLEDGVTVFVFDFSVFVYLPVDVEVFFSSGFSSLYLFFLHKGSFVFLQLDTLIEKYCLFHLTYESIPSV